MWVDKYSGARQSEKRTIGYRNIGEIYTSVYALSRVQTLEENSPFLVIGF